MTSPRFALRPRSGWEAADLGILIWRSRPLVIITFTLIPALTAIALFSLFFRGIEFPLWLKDFSPYFPLFAAGWFKPLYDRCALHICSTLFFKEAPRLRDFFAGLGRGLLRGLVGDILWRRFSPWRGVMIPLRVLETPRRVQLTRRKRALAQGGLMNGALITVLCVALELVLQICLLLFIYSTESLAGSHEIPGALFSKPPIVFIIATEFTSILIETLYVCMSFGIYINSRVITEGWDLQFIFRHLAAQSPRILNR